MAFLTQLSRAQFAQNLATEYASAAALPANTGPGSDLGAIFNAESMNSIILQQQIAYVNSVARLGTIGPNPTNSNLPNPDVDSFVNPFNVFRIAAAPSSGQVIFSIASPASQNIQIPAITTAQLIAGAPAVIVQTTPGINTPGGVQFAVVVDVQNPNYNATFSSYTISAGSLSVSCTVQCLSSGIIGNVGANQINQLFSGPGTITVGGISAVNNPLAFNNAIALESDTALKNRFALAMSTGTVATSNAIAATILGVQIGLTYSVGDQLNAAGVATPSAFTVVVNNAGVATSPSATLLAQVTAAVAAVKPAGINFIGAIAPTLIPVNITAAIKLAPGYSGAGAAVSAAVTTVLQSFINNIGLSPTGLTTICPLSAVYAAMQAVPGVAYVDTLLLNGAAVDVAAAFAQQLVAGTILLTPF